ncbi:MAG: redoxin domain-containing protein [Deltaproteobacteria bacterium]|nr:redoxin domain-containing protein [Deltaproteobacteria bacterium]
MILGISTDSVAKNKKFADKFAFPYKLLSDVDRKIGVAYGAIDPGETKKGARRITYVIENGKITAAYQVKDAGAHPKALLDDLNRR